MVFTMVPRVRAFRAGCGNSFDARSARRQIMPARETEAIILKTFPLGEADRLVSFLGRSSGRVRGVAPGARRLKNRYGSTPEVQIGRAAGRGRGEVLGGGGLFKKKKKKTGWRQSNVRA